LEQFVFIKIPAHSVICIALIYIAGLVGISNPTLSCFQPYRLLFVYS